MNSYRLRAAVLSVCIMSQLSFGTLGQSPDQLPAKSTDKSSQPRSSMRSDVDIQKCIQGKLAGSEKLRAQDFTVSVSNSEATFTGTARNAGSKGAVTRIGQSCGAVKVVNNISAPAIPRPAQPTAKVDGRTNL